VNERIRKGVQRLQHDLQGKDLLGLPNVSLYRLPAYLSGSFIGSASKLEEFEKNKIEVESSKEFLGKTGKELIEEKHKTLPQMTKGVQIILTSYALQLWHATLQTMEFELDFRNNEYLQYMELDRLTDAYLNTDFVGKYYKSLL